MTGGRDPGWGFGLAVAGAAGLFPAPGAGPGTTSFWSLAGLTSTVPAGFALSVGGGFAAAGRFAGGAVCACASLVFTV